MGQTNYEVEIQHYSRTHCRRCGDKLNSKDHIILCPRCYSQLSKEADKSARTARIRNKQPKACCKDPDLPTTNTGDQSGYSGLWDNAVRIYEG